MDVTYGPGQLKQRPTRIGIFESTLLVTCPRCWSPPGTSCVVPGHDSSDTGGSPTRRVHYARWNLAAHENHDTGDEDRT